MRVHSLLACFCAMLPLAGCGDDVKRPTFDQGDMDAGDDGTDAGHDNGEPEPDASTPDGGMDASTTDGPPDASMGDGHDAGSTTTQDSGTIEEDAGYTYDGGNLPDGVNSTMFCGDYAAICGYLDPDHYDTPGDCQNSFQSYSDSRKGCVIAHLEMAEQDEPSQESEHCESAAGAAPCD